MTNRLNTSVNLIDTIVALATAPGRAGIAIVRVSGPLVSDIARHIVKQLPTPRFALHTLFQDKHDIPIDEGIAIFFKAPHSFTGEDVLELQGHGGPAVVDLLIETVLQLGARLARPGEFSERAFLNDKLDLAQAEAIADLIDATSQQAARSAFRSLQGDFSDKIHALVQSITHLRMYVEAAIDFVEEEIDFLADGQVGDQLERCISQLESIQGSATQGRLLREGITVVIAGEPNVGKSSLLNALSGNDSAIVTDIPGTTRDVLREHISIDGMPLHIIDTAGLRESADVVEQEGIRRAHHEIQHADIILHVVSANSGDEVKKINTGFALTSKTDVILVRNKIDLMGEAPAISVIDHQTVISLSAKGGLGLDLLKNHIKSSVGFLKNTEGSFSARRRHIDALNRAHELLLNGQQQLKDYRAGELLAEDLRLAQHHLSEITGEFTSDDLLGEIFSSFCIGK